MEHLHPRWGILGGMAVALDFGSSAVEKLIAERLALCDASAFERISIKGANAATFLQEQNLPTPEEIYATASLPANGLIARTGTAEFFLEDSAHGSTVGHVRKALGKGKEGVYPVLREDASFLVSGTEAIKVLMQTCGYDFRQADSRMVYSRVAMVSCAILPRILNRIPVFQLWLDATYGAYLWKTLLAIVRDLRGNVVGLSVFIAK
jgi:sarcosine oxidase subunit gamma